MKRQIRQGVFETNSSSTHSLQIAKTDEVKDIVMNKILDSYGDDLKGFSPYGDNNNLSELVVDGVLYLRGFEEDYVDQQTFSSHIITNPLFKIQYLFSFLYAYIQVTYYYDDCHMRKPETEKSVENKFIEKLPEYIMFKNAVMDFLRRHNEYASITDIKLYDGMKYDDVYGNEDNNCSLNYRIFTCQTKFQAVFDEVMQDGTSITSFDVPYSMYNSPQIKIY